MVIEQGVTSLYVITVLFEPIVEILLVFAVSANTIMPVTVGRVILTCKNNAVCSSDDSTCSHMICQILVLSSAFDVTVVQMKLWRVLDKPETLEIRT